MANEKSQGATMPFQVSVALLATLLLTPPGIAGPAQES
jgi:hypothetical protein